MYERTFRPAPTGAIASVHFSVPMPRVRTARPLKPNEARVRYHDGSSYHLAHVVDVAAAASGAIVLRQALSKRANVQGALVHFVPGHNVDVVSWRQAGLRPADLDQHDHCPRCGDHHTELDCPWRTAPVQVPWRTRVLQYMQRLWS